MKLEIGIPDKSPQTVITHLGALLAAHEAIVRNLPAELEKAGLAGDAGTSDFLTGLMEEHEKLAGMLRVARPRVTSRGSAESRPPADRGANDDRASKRTLEQT
jgi:hypothetical protein